MKVTFHDGPLNGSHDYPKMQPPAPPAILVADGRPKMPTEPPDPLAEAYYLDATNVNPDSATYLWRKWRLESFGAGGIKVRMEESPHPSFGGMKGYVFQVATKYDQAKPTPYFALVARYNGFRVEIRISDDFAPCFTHIKNPTIQEGPPK